MLSSLSKRETSRYLGQRYLPNCLPTTRYQTARSRSTQEERYSLDQTTLQSELQTETQEILGSHHFRARAQDTRRKSLFKTSPNSAGNEAAPQRALESRKLSREGDDKYKVLEATRSQENGDAAVATTWRPFNPNIRSSERSASIRSNTAPLTSTGPIREKSDSILRDYGLPGNLKDSVMQNLHEDDSRVDAPFLDELDDDQMTTWRTNAELGGPITEKLANLRKIMATRNPQALLKYMMKTSDDLEFVNAIPAVTFIELLRELQPEDDYLPMRPEYNGQGPKHYRMLSGLRHTFYQSLRSRRHFYQDIASKRIASGRKLRIGEYTQLMNLARATWDGPMALNIMKNMIASKVAPNLTCYNHYFEARGWADAYHPDERQRLRVIPYNIARRKMPYEDYPRYGVPLVGHRVEEDGIRWEITRMFTKMVNDGINADTRAYCSLIIAHSREGDVRAIKAVVSRVWRIDVEALLAGQPDPEENKLAKDSPTYPTKELLFTLAHAFGSNSDMPAAMRLVDHFARNYDLTIPQKVWEELMSWTFVLSSGRRKLRWQDGAAEGKLPLVSLENLWYVMRGPPYYSEPSMVMYDYVIRSFARRDLRKLYDFLHFMREGVKFHERETAAYEAAYQRLVDALKEEGGCDQDQLEVHRLRAEEAKAKRWLAYIIVSKWFQLLLNNQRWLGNPWTREIRWSRRILPQVIREFWQFKSKRPVSYPVRGGRIELEDPEEELTKEQKAARAAAGEVESLEHMEECAPIETPEVEGKRFTKEGEWTEKDRKILEQDEKKSEEVWAEESAEKVRQELDDL